MVELINDTDTYTAAFERVAGAASGPLRPIRETAIERFTTLGFPTTRDEEWRFTNVSAIAKTPFEPAAPATPRELPGADAAILDDAWPRLVLVNGYVDTRRSALGTLPAGVRVTSLAAAIAADDAVIGEHLARYAPMDQHPFTALNTALMQDGVVVVASRGAVIERPIHLIHATVPGVDRQLSVPRTLVVAEPGSQVTVVESFVQGVAGDATCFTNAVTEIVACDGAVVDHYKMQDESTDGYHVGTTHIYQDRSSNASSHTISIGAALARHDMTTILDGEGGECHLNGLYLIDGKQHVDNHLRVEHRKPRCDSREFFKGILDGASHAVFTGRIVVAEDAQKTDGKQTNQNLLLSDDAAVDTKPQLEIFADDVKCTHGATIGQLDDDAIFYLRSRGMGRDIARDMLVYAFAAEALERVRPEPLRRRLDRVLYDRLPHGQLLAGRARS